jgi:mono/diheme cytochrome c family protein
MRRMLTKKLVGRVALGAVGIFVVAQFVPYGRAHSNPPVTRAAQWDSAQTAGLVAGACNDCHSNLTKWRWYSNIAPGSWLIQNDVDGGRNHLNFSRWDTPQPSVHEVIRQISRGGMPPLQYKLVHPAARLSKQDKAALIAGLRATFAHDPPPVRSGGG